MAKKIDEKTMLENIENLRSELSETKGFLQTYMLDPDPDSRPAEDERLKTVVRLAGEMEDILAQLTGGVHTEEVKEETAEEKEAAAAVFDYFRHFYRQLFFSCQYHVSHSDRCRYRLFMAAG